MRRSPVDPVRIARPKDAACHPACQDEPGWLAAFDWFGHHYLFHHGVAFAAGDLRAERQHVVLIGENHGAIHGGETGHGIDGPVELAGVVRRGSSQLRQNREWGRHGVGNWRHDGFAPSVAGSGNHQQRSATAVRAHGYRELHQHIDRVLRCGHPGGNGFRSKQRGQQRRAIGDGR